MVESDRQKYVAPLEKFPDELRLNHFVFDVLQGLPTENQNEVLDNYVMGQSLLKLTDIELSLGKFTTDHFTFTHGNEDKISPYYRYRFFQTYNHTSKKPEMNVMNSIDVSIIDKDSNHAFRYGFGIINMKKFGGYVFGQEGIENPDDDQITKHVLEKGIRLNLANQKSLFLDDSLLGEIEEYATFFLEDEYKSYWDKMVDHSITNTRVRREGLDKTLFEI